MFTGAGLDEGTGGSGHEQYIIRLNRQPAIRSAPVLRDENFEVLPVADYQGFSACEDRTDLAGIPLTD